MAYYGTACYVLIFSLTWRLSRQNAYPTLVNSFDGSLQLLSRANSGAHSSRRSSLTCHVSAQFYESRHNLNQSQPYACPVRQQIDASTCVLGPFDSALFHSLMVFGIRRSFEYSALLFGMICSFEPSLSSFFRVAVLLIAPLAPRTRSAILHCWRCQP